MGIVSEALKNNPELRTMGGAMGSFRSISDHGHKETEGKLSYELDFAFIEQMAQRMAANKGKYEPYNWKRPIDTEKLKQSLFRHVIAVMKREYEDDGRENGHLEAIAINAMLINWQLKMEK